MGRRKQMVYTNLKCTCCGNIWNIPRVRGDARERGHLKDTWCIVCKKITKHQDFLNEYDVTGPYTTWYMEEEKKKEDQKLDTVGNF